MRAEWSVVDDSSFGGSAGFAASFPASAGLPSLGGSLRTRAHCMAREHQQRRDRAHAPELSHQFAPVDFAGSPHAGFTQSQRNGLRIFVRARHRHRLGVNSRRRRASLRFVPPGARRRLSLRSQILPSRHCVIGRFQQSKFGTIHPPVSAPTDFLQCRLSPSRSRFRADGPPAISLGRGEDELGSRPSPSYSLSTTAGRPSA